MAVAGDWLSFGGDPQHSGWQRYGLRLTVPTMKTFRLIWKRPLEGEFRAPVILGPTVTHRGVRELALLQSASDTLQAIDVDFGKVFWQGRFGSKERAARPACGSGWPLPLPVIATDPEDDLGDPVADEDDNDDEPANMRPVYLLASDGRLHTIRPSDGKDIAEPLPFLPAGAVASDLNFAADRAYAVTPDGCGTGRPGYGPSR